MGMHVHNLAQEEEEEDDAERRPDHSVFISVSTTFGAAHLSLLA